LILRFELLLLPALSTAITVTLARTVRRFDSARLTARADLREILSA
jgi:hypothetical protein